ncbi:MAG: DUF1127 domain-containing protein [Rhodobacteraceae bacterium]|nr:DUF1127 domain-containing protein [Paracoccaceae bacterium]
MSVMTTNRPVSSLFGGIAGGLVSTVVAWNEARSTRNALSRLSDRELDDIGLCRGDIDTIASHL